MIILMRRTRTRETPMPSSGSRPPLRVVVAGAVLMTLFAAPGEAQACKRACLGSQALLPAPDATDVPLNARIWLDYWHFGSRSVLLTGDGEEVELSTAQISTGAGQVYVLTPSPGLLPGQRYEYWSSYQGQLTDLHTWFTTGTTADYSPPPLPVEISRSSKGYNPCGSVCLSAGAEVNVVLSGEGLFVVDVGSEQTLDASEPRGFVTIASGDGQIHMETLCGSWPGKVNQTKSIRYGSYDLAGNFSGWTEPSDIHIRGVPAMCTCSTTPATTPVLWTLVLLLLCGRRWAIRWRSRR